MKEVYLSDENMSYDEAIKFFYQAGRWAKEHCSSYQGSNIQDVSDVSPRYDQIGCYRFNDERDAVTFMLRWK